MRNKRASFDALFARFHTRTWLISDFFVIIIAETGSEEGVYTPNHSSTAITQQQGSISVEAIWLCIIRNLISV
jgi:hypothetical protein